MIIITIIMIVNIFENIASIDLLQLASRDCTHKQLVAHNSASYLQQSLAAVVHQSVISREVQAQRTICSSTLHALIHQHGG